MKFLMFLFLSLSVILISCGDDEDNPTSPTVNQTKPLIPLAIGNEWEYDVVFKSASSQDDFYEAKLVIEDSKVIDYEGAEVTVFKMIEYNNGNAGSPNWNFVFGSRYYFCKNPDNLEKIYSMPNSISYEEATNSDGVLIGSNTVPVSVETLKIMGNEMECIKLSNENAEQSTSMYYKPGIGLVKVVSENKKFGAVTINTLKSYTLK